MRHKLHAVVPTVSDDFVDNVRWTSSADAKQTFSGVYSRWKLDNKVAVRKGATLQ